MLEKDMLKQAQDVLCLKEESAKLIRKARSAEEDLVETLVGSRATWALTVNWARVKQSIMREL